MATLKFDGKTYTVDHAAKGTDYVHGFDADGNILISIDGVSDFSAIEYSDTYMSPTDCLTEVCNDLKYCGSALKTRDGRSVSISDCGAATGDVNMDSHKITGVGAPTADSDAVNLGTAKTEKIQFTLYADQWAESAEAGYTHSIYVGSLTEGKNAKVSPAWPTALADKLAMSEDVSKIRACARSQTATGSTLTFECWEEKPASDVSVVVEVYL